MRPSQQGLRPGGKRDGLLIDARSETFLGTELHKGALYRLSDVTLLLARFLANKPCRKEARNINRA